MNKLNTFIKCMNGQMNLYLYALHSPSPKNIISLMLLKVSFIILGLFIGFGNKNGNLIY